MNIFDKTLARSTSRRTPTHQPQQRRGWLYQLLRRLHFYAGIFVGPFILIAALSGALYAMTPQIEQALYAKELHAPLAQDYLPLSQQVQAANDYLGLGQSPLAVRPAPNPGDTTRVMYLGEGLGPSESRAIFIDPATAEVRGDLTVYGTSGSLPLRTWIDQVHRNLHLGEAGRLYSELAASWLGIIAVAGLGLWIMRATRSKQKKNLSRPGHKAQGFRRLANLHTSLGLWVLLGAVFLSATGITWSTYGGANVGKLRAALSWQTPAVNTSLADQPMDMTGEHAEHHHHAMGMMDHSVDPIMFDHVLTAAKDENIDTGLLEIKPPAAADQAWVVQEIKRSFPTQIDQVAIDGNSLNVVDRNDFADYGLAAKLSRWGIDAHMGTLFGLPNQILLLALALSIAAMVVLGYLMWWKRRPTKIENRRMGNLPARGGFVRAPWWGCALVVIIALVLGAFLPLLGTSLALFLVVDFLVVYTARFRGAVAGKAEH